MKLHKRTLKNGLRIQAVEMPGTNVVTTLVLAGAGSRHEEMEISGIAHFLEHMFFKGAKKFPTPKSVSESVDAVGGKFNAFTGKEQVGYYVKTGKVNLDISLDVLSDMLLHAKFPPEEIEKERGVILEEMAMYQDTPTYQIMWDIESLIFGDQPLGRDQIGTKEFIKSVRQQDFRNYMNDLYVPKNIVITIAGAVDEKDIDKAEKYFQFEDGDKNREHVSFDPDLAKKKYSIREKNTEQYHINFGVRAMSEQSEEYPTLRVLAAILGGNMSARMFQNVREEKGLSYSIHTETDGFTDTGYLTTRAGVKLGDVLKAIEAIRYEYDDVVKNGISEKELEKAKGYLVGQIDLETEDTEKVANHFAYNELFYRKTDDFEEEKRKIESVTKEQVEELAKKLLRPENFRLAGIGPEIKERELLPLIS
ncbi:MAG: pitrilysin family protein [Candidatus Pacebacteria bacterium]|jgi:predicted Zn-dependent peptidase|nr:hypothetical protein [bacterium]MDP6527772.1 pitrilysin family protein [Candidatus Paceibacterota bacterium]MDP6659609.1 pitrilysin family protein [Candidatus Paceibacterota bacterium]|tara:strand:+ start:39056 stop:40318 length:1263 start_codon:yes stop_codon:yes gene_type:complete